MFEYIFILTSGLIILFFGFYDFLYTTISVSSASLLTKITGNFIQKIINILSKIVGRKAFNYCGMMVNISLMIVWILIIWIGLFLVFTFDKQSIIQSNGEIANSIERLYYTGSVLSTLGMGNFYPISTFSNILTSVFSFAGFIFFTTSMTYLISVYAAVINKSDFSNEIQKLGNHPLEVIHSLKQFEKDFRLIQIHSLKEKLDRVTQQYKAYPIIYYYHHSEIELSFSRNLAVFDEAITLILASSQDFPEEWKYIRKSINSFLEFHLNNNENILAKIKLKIDQQVKASVNYPSEFLKDEELIQRRKILQHLLSSENLNWSDVYTKEKSMI